MASIKISELEEVTELSTSDVLPIINNNETKKVSIKKLNEVLGGSGGETDLSNYYNKDETEQLIDSGLETKQDKLTAGENITIVNNVISSTGGSGGSSEGVDYIYEINTGVKAFDLWENTNSFDKTNILNSIGSIITDIHQKFSTNENFAPMLKLNFILDHRTSYNQALQSYILMGITKYSGFAQFAKDTKPSTIYFSCRIVNQYMSTSRTNTQFLMTVNGGWNGTETFTPSSVAFTKEDVEFLSKTNTDEYTPTSDYNPATKKYVDDAVAAGNGGGNSGGDVTDVSKIRVIHMTETHLSPGSANYTNQKISATDQQLLCDFINESYNIETAKHTLAPVLVYGRSMLYITEFGFSNISDGTTQFKFNFRGPTLTGSMRYGYVDLRLRYETDKYVISSGTLSSSEDTTYLKKYNTSSYTPTSDYHPATKKYVDDSITSAITSVLEAEY